MRIDVIEVDGSQNNNIKNGAIKYFNAYIAFTRSRCNKRYEIERHEPTGRKKKTWKDHTQAKKKKKFTYNMKIEAT